MNPDPFSFKHALADFDLAKLPVDPSLLQSDSAILANSVQAYYEELLRKMGGTAAVAIMDDVVSVTWYPASGDAVEIVSQHAQKLLNQGDYKSAEPLLRMLQAKKPDDAELLYNLGMMLSDQQKLDEAIPMLESLVEIDPETSNGWTALGVAYSRNQELEKSERALRHALEIDPDNAYALRNLGAIQRHTAPELALAGLKKAARMMPNDPQAQYAYAQCLIDLGQNEEADPILQRVIDMDGLSETAELARTARRTIAQESMRDSAGGGLKMDAVFFCLDAMKRFQEMGDEKMRAAVYEIAVLGRGGLDVHDTTPKYALKSMPGQFTGLHLVSLMFVGFRQIDPSLDGGIDLSPEYAEAKKLFTIM
jgi:tetratricopeptide (TPR) repeat protein